MTKVDLKLAVVIPPYSLGEPVTFTQHFHIPFDLFGLAKELEQYKLNQMTVSLYKVANRNVYTLGIDMGKSMVKTVDAFFEEVAKRLGVENDQKAIATKIHSILARHTL